MTPHEKILWNQLRNRAVGGLKFRRQQPVDGYIADFCCLEKGIVVELDGAPHNRRDQKIYDAERDAYFEAKGYCVLRFTNDQIEKKLDKVIEEIEKASKLPLACLRERGFAIEKIVKGEGPWNENFAS